MKLTRMFLLFLILSTTLCFGLRSAADAQPALSITSDLLNGSGYEAYIAGLLSDIRVSEQLSSTLNDTYERNSAEIQRILVENPHIALRTVSIALEAMPSLKAASENEGILIVDAGIYSRADGLVRDYERLASPKLSRDLGKVRETIERRITERFPDSLVIDLGQP
jgi:hypothetical protein